MLLREILYEDFGGVAEDLDLFEWCHVWLWGPMSSGEKYSKTRNTYYLPSDKVIAELAQYLPTERATYFRSNPYAPRGFIESWTAVKDFADFLTHETGSGEDRPDDAIHVGATPRATIKRTVDPRDVLVDLTKVPGLDVPVHEVVLPNGPFMKHMKEVRRISRKR